MFIWGAMASYWSIIIHRKLVKEVQIILKTFYVKDAHILWIIILNNQMKSDALFVQILPELWYFVLMDQIYKEVKKLKLILSKLADKMEDLLALVGSICVVSTGTQI